VVDLASDSEDELFPGDGFEFFDARSERAESAENVDMHEFDVRYNPFYDDPDGVIDLTGIPDIDIPPSDAGLAQPEAQEHENFDDDDLRLVTEALGLQMVLDFLPDISIDHHATRRGGDVSEGSRRGEQEEEEERRGGGRNGVRQG
jgi:TRIAD3 protein (E3 ubiquitin-protein ligase RNF216)